MSQNVIEIIFTRFFFGFFYGIIAPIASTLITEIVPSKFRGGLVITSFLMFPIGELLSVIYAWCTFED